METAYLIDGSSFSYRAFYALPELQNSQGRPTNAVFGFATMLHRLIREVRPDYLAVSFDLKAPTFRHQRFKAYKGHRKPTPEALVAQLPLIKELVRAYNIPIFEKEGFEADDLLGALAESIAGPERTVYIVTGDKDMLQLVNDHIKVYNPHNEDIIYGRKEVFEKMGVPPEHVTDLIGLMGDSSDNIPGVSGIGPKKAVELLRAYTTIENIYAHIDDIGNTALKNMLRTYKENALLSKELATIDCHVDIDIALDDLRVKGPDEEKLFTLFKELGFKKLIKDFAPKKDAHDLAYALVDDKKSLEALIKALRGEKEISFDFETTGTDPLTAELVGVGFSWEEGSASYVPLCDDKDFKSDDVLQKLKPVFEDPRIAKIGQNIKYELLLLKTRGIRLAHIAFDTMIASYLLNPTSSGHSLDDLAIEYLGRRLTPISDLIGKGKKQITMDKVDRLLVKDYCCADAEVTFALSKILRRLLEEKQLYALMQEVELPLVEVLAEMEYHGIYVDTAFLKKMSASLENALARHRANIFELADCEFNINSPKQLQDVLFNRLGLTPVKKTKTGASTDVEVLTRLSQTHPLPAAILEYRELTKLQSGYVEAIPGLVNPRTKRVHTSYNQTVTATGRLSSSDPNLQNIPVKTDIGKEIRKAFVPQKEGWHFLSADYSQIELRILAHLSKDEALREAFAHDKDVHAHTASLVFGTDKDLVTEYMRATAKTINFGVIYGMSPYGLAKELGISIDQAKDFIESYFARYPRVRDYMEEEIAFARDNGFVKTLFNRRRYLPYITSGDETSRMVAERIAINTPVQGTAADLIKIAMIKIQALLQKRAMASMMILQVHDELVFEAPKEELERLSKLVEDCMEHAIALEVPIKTNIKTGKSWFEVS
jgi:DNA polymerase-1